MANSLKYPLLPFSQLVYDLTRWAPRIYTFSVTFVWPNGANEQKRITDAIRLAISNHLAFTMHVDGRSLHYSQPLRDNLHGKFHDVNVFTKGEDLFVAVKFNRILGDGFSVAVIFQDVVNAYNGVALQPDDYWGYIEQVEKNKLSPLYMRSKEWLECEFCDTTIPVRPTIDRRWLFTFLPPKLGVFSTDYTTMHNDIRSFLMQQHIILDGFFSLCTALAIAEYCGTDSAALTWAYDGREKDYEQRIFGSLHRDVPFKIKMVDDKNELIRQARNQIRSGIAHSNYPYTLTYPYTSRWNYAVNVLRMPDIKDYLSIIPFPVAIAKYPKQKYAYALLDVEIHESSESLEIIYRYSATHYKPESIQRFAALVRKYAEWLLEDEK